MSTLPISTQGLVIRPADASDLDRYADHILRHAAESGREGSVHFAISRTPERPSVREQAYLRWERGMDEPLWGRCFALIEPDGGHMVGHLELRGGRFLAEMHRAALGMGIERGYTRQGHGRGLMEFAIGWARRSERIAWIDLGVFEHNLGARALYQRMGFVETGRRKDSFRIDSGLSVTDVSMSMWVG